MFMCILRMLKTLYDERNDDLSGARVIFEFGEVVVVVVPGSQAEERGGEESENGCRSAPGCDGETGPLDDLAEEIGSRHVLEHASGRDLVAGLSGLT